jgi:hypothetical protein
MDKRAEESIWSRSRRDTLEEDKDSFLQFVDKIRQLGIEVDRLEKITSLIGTEKELTKTKDLLKEGRKNANLLIENIKNSEPEDKNKKSITEKKEYERVLQEKDKIILRLEEVISESEKKLVKKDFSKKTKSNTENGEEIYNEEGKNFNI